MSTQDYSRWYIVPSEEYGTTEPGIDRRIRPKYSDKSDLDGHSAIQVSPTTVGEYDAALVDQYPSVDPWYLVHYFASGDAGWQALNEISNQNDTRSLASNPDDVERVLNERLPGANRSAEEWAQSFAAHR